MPDENEVPKIVSDFEDWLNDRADLPEGITVSNFDDLSMVIYFRLRSLFTVEDMHTRMHIMMTQGETLLHTPGMLTDADGKSVMPVLRENFADLNDAEYQKLLEQTSREVTDDDLAELFGEPA